MNAFLLLLCTLVFPAQKSDLAERLDPALSEIVERHHLPGLAVGITDRDEILYARGFGELSRGSGKPITPESIFHMASVSKPFVATAVMTLVEAGKMDLDENVVTYLPYFELADERYREITVRQVLMHRSGMTDVEDYEWDHPQHDEGAAERFVRSMKDEALLFAPGETFAYSNMAFDMMGDVIAKVSGMPFEDYVKQAILEPLGMQSSSFIHAETPEALRTVGHSPYYTKRMDFPPSPHYPYNRRHAPSSTMNSSVVDMCRWARANLNRGELGDARILEEASYEELWGQEEDPRIGLSWFLGEHAGHRTVSHGGSDIGFRTHLRLLPDEGLAVVVLTNRDLTPVTAITDILTNAALGRSFELPTPGVSIPFVHRMESEGVGSAIELYFELRESEPERWEFSFGQLDMVSYWLVRFERYDEAIEILAFNADLYSSMPRAHFSLGRAQQAAGDLDGARESYEHALTLAPGDPEIRGALDRLGS